MSTATHWPASRYRTDETIAALRSRCRLTNKYRPAFVVGGERVLRYDNEVGKGDHVHSEGKERAYVFVDPDQLVADFFADVRGWLDANRDT